MLEQLLRYRESGLDVMRTTKMFKNLIKNERNENEIRSETST